MTVSILAGLGKDDLESLEESVCHLAAQINSYRHAVHRGQTLPPEQERQLVSEMVSLGHLLTFLTDTAAELPILDPYEPDSPVIVGTTVAPARSP